MPWSHVRSLSLRFFHHTQSAPLLPPYMPHARRLLFLTHLSCLAVFKGNKYRDDIKSKYLKFLWQINALKSFCSVYQKLIIWEQTYSCLYSLRCWYIWCGSGHEPDSVF
jgi:hypothetical protein